MTVPKLRCYILMFVFFGWMDLSTCTEVTLHTYIEGFWGVSYGFAKTKVNVAEETETALQACQYARKHDVKQKNLIAEHLWQNKSVRYFQTLFSLAALLSGTSVMLALYLSWRASYATQCVRNFRALIEFRQRYENCMCTLESRLSVQEIDFTYRRKTFVYPGDVAVPANMQANNVPIQSAARHRDTEDMSFPSINADEDENLEGRTDFHAFERAAVGVELRALRRWRLNFMFATCLISLVIQVFFSVANLFIDKSDIGAILVPLCELELEAHRRGELDCRPHINAQTIEALDTLMSLKRNSASETHWSLGFLDFGNIMSVVIILGSFYHGGQQLIDNTPKKNVHLPRKHFTAFIVGATISWMTLAFNLMVAYSFLSKFVQNSLILQTCINEIYTG